MRESKTRHLWSHSVLGAMIVLLVTACGSSGGDDPIGADTPRVVFDDGGALAARRAAITRQIEDTIILAAAQLPVDDVVVTVRADAARAIPGYGLAGFALGPQRVEIVIDPQFPDLDTILITRLPYVTAHELHHTVRLRNPGIYTTLLEALIFEGMADHFAVELLFSDLAPWSTAFDEFETSVYLERARPLFDSGFNFEVWFFGIGSDLPQWTGYTLGYRILRDYFDANPQESAVTLVNAPADQFRP